ncbi:4-hydroxy-2-oxoheptanedioate aldolase [Nocardioides terrae]|uniref:4-hydroxy-2-oxoheptanedioate aldolase n=1 Tax=Nocardioides terrae TaxID=574651 RepID=A0A1I1K6L2_9ACTN|nr:aldolase/citrate lyase family protein [Nocardioides terrae]SFC56474.1 4-hydroxy-2-oxoheptanedioate aldolase [Nocardioides terrae]
MSSRGHVPTLRARLAAGDDLVGALVRMPSEEIVEMLAVAGHDFVLVDCEHGSADLGALRHHVTAAESFGLPVMVRYGAGDTPFLLRALDLGVQGVVAPHVDSADDAERLLRAVRYPPRGDRGYATYSRAGRYGALGVEEHLRRAEDVLVVAMIESPAAVRAAAEITGVPGIDGYLIGTSDLGASRAGDDPSLSELVATTHASAADVVRCDLAGSAEAARAALADGARVVVHNLTLSMMALLRELRV